MDTRVWRESRSAAAGFVPLLGPSPLVEQSEAQLPRGVEEECADRKGEHDRALLPVDEVVRPSEERDAVPKRPHHLHLEHRCWIGLWIVVALGDVGHRTVGVSDPRADSVAHNIGASRCDLIGHDVADAHVVWCRRSDNEEGPWWQRGFHGRGQHGEGSPADGKGQQNRYRGKGKHQDQRCCAE